MAGIDYGLGKTNIDTANGIRYGVISQHSMADWFFDEFEAQYGDPHCPKCGGEARDASTDASTAEQMKETDEYESLPGYSDYACDECRITFDAESAFPEEPIGGFKLEDNEYLAVDCLDSDVMIIRAPFYTYAPFCSPCVPGAGNLNDAARETNPMHTATEDLYAYGVRTYCFGHDWFNDRRAPYRVFRVDTNEEVLPPTT